jgi:uncharacterized damage-inducible protein DinB
MTTIARFYRGWLIYQGRLVTCVALLTPEQLALRSAPHLRAISTIAAHIVSARAYWFHRVLGEGDAALAPLRAWDDVDPAVQTGAELARGLSTTWATVDAALRRWTPDDLDAPFPVRERTVTREWVVWHVLEHDLHHGGELFLSCGMHGLPTPEL